MLMKARILPLQQASLADSACSSCQVRPKALFSVLPADELPAAASTTTPLTFEPGDSLYLQGHLGRVVFTLRSGIVRFERGTSDGQRRIVRLAGAGALIGQESILRSPYAEDAVACTPVEVCSIPVSSVEAYCDAQPELHRELMRRWQSALEAAGEWNAELTCGPARRRVLKLLQQLQLLSADGRSIWLPSRQEMGDMLGLAVETASRIVSRLRREAVLQVASLTQARVDPARLAQAVAGADL